MKNGKARFKIFCAILAIAFALILCGCSGQPTRDPYEIATDLGYEGSAAEWLSGTVGGSSETRKMYREVCEDGYTGSYLEFLKELGLSVGGDAALGSALTASVDVVCLFNYPRTGFSAASRFKSLGSGVIYKIDREKGDAYIVTNYHILYSSSSDGNEKIPHMSDEISVYLYGAEIDSRAIPAAYLGGTQDYDIAVLKIEDSEVIRESDARAIVSADSYAVTAGEKVYSVGNADGGGLSVCSGIVSVEHEYINIKSADDKYYIRLPEIRTDAPLNHGNSGGGLFNENGAFIGLVNARSEITDVVNVGYAIPSNLVVSVAQNIIDNAKVNSSRGALCADLGVTTEIADAKSVYDEKSGKVYRMETVVAEIVEWSGVSNGKIEPGDVFYAIGIRGGAERTVTQMQVIEDMLFNVRKGDTLYVILSRGEEKITVEIPFTEDELFTLCA